MTAFHNGVECRTVTFSVIEPSGVMMETITNALSCNADPLTTLYNADVYIEPDSVSFYACVFGEAAATAHGSGYFSYADGINVPAGTASDTDGSVVAGKGTHLFATDTIGIQTTGAVYSVGTLSVNIPWLYATMSGSNSYQFTTTLQSGELAVTATNAVLTVEKAGSSGACHN